MIVLKEREYHLKISYLLALINDIHLSNKWLMIIYYTICLK
jgi:hypothetical protein